HMNSDDVVELLKGVKPKMAILQHFGRSMIEAGPAAEAVEIQTKSGVKTVAAQDGLVEVGQD
ncbi:MAG: MBL fold metallo-hydrolase, partial [bacterium]|nr:MBL fold metallo-hydrolase [bacterium]